MASSTSPSPPVSRFSCSVTHEPSFRSLLFLRLLPPARRRFRRTDTGRDRATLSPRPGGPVAPGVGALWARPRSAAHARARAAPPLNAGSRASQAWHSLFRRLFFESASLPAKTKLTLQSFAVNNTQAAQDEPPLSPQKRAALRRSWARLIRRVYLTDPLICECGGELRVIAFITDDNVIRKILSHLAAPTTDSRAPP